MTGRIDRRISALNAAVALPWPKGFSCFLGQEVLEAAFLFDEWLIEPAPVTSFTLTADPPRDRPTTEGPGAMSLTFPDTQQVTLHVGTVVDSEGETVVDTFTWSVDDGNVLTLTPSEDSMSCDAVPATTSGPATVTATASDGVARTFAVDVTAGPTAGFEITADAPVDRPAPAA